MIYSNYKPFLDRIFEGLTEVGIDVTDLNIDHIAYQTASSEEYEKLKPELMQTSQLVKEPLVADRRVGVFKFNEPLEYERRVIETIELIEPVEGVDEVSGLQHAEFLLDVSFEVFLAKYPDIDFELNKMSDEKFPMIKLRLPNGLMVKFPKYPILFER